MSSYINIGVCTLVNGADDKIHSVSIELPGPCSDCPIQVRARLSWSEVSMVQRDLTQALRNMSDRAKERDPIGDHIAFVDWELKCDSLEVQIEELKGLLKRIASYDVTPSEIDHYVELP
jgi:hypothetical protein